MTARSRPERSLSRRLVAAAVRPEVRLFGRRVPSFRFWALVGFAAGVSFLLALGRAVGLDRAVLLGVAAAGVAAFLLLAALSRVVTGAERFSYFHHLIGVALASAGLVWLLGEPVLAYADVTLLALGLLQATGRIGCLGAGCCHGRLSKWGVRYGAGHVAAGFPRHLQGLRLLPVQPLEAAWSLLVVLTGTYLVLHHAPGTAAAWYLLHYGLGRFALEFLRGDAERPFFRGFSEAQWTAWALSVAVALAAAAGVLPFHGWTAVSPALITGAVAWVAVARWRDGEGLWKIRQPAHLRELATLLEWAPVRQQPSAGRPESRVSPASVHVGCTSLGLRLSASLVRGAEGESRILTLSGRGGPLDRRVASAVAASLLALLGDPPRHRLLAAGTGTFHLVVENDPPARAPAPAPARATTPERPAAVPSGRGRHATEPPREVRPTGTLAGPRVPRFGAGDGDGAGAPVGAAAGAGAVPFAAAGAGAVPFAAAPSSDRVAVATAHT